MFLCIEGYGTSTEGVPYYKFKNCWGTDWGNNGYIKIIRGVPDPEGMCKLLTYATYPSIG